MANSDKTEQATPRRKQKAREKGQVARSRDLVSSLAIGATLITIAMQSSRFALTWRGLLRRVLDASAAGDLPGTSALLWTVKSLVVPMAAIIGLAWLAAAMAAVSQGGLVFAAEALQPNLSRLNPASRMEQLFSLPSLGRLLKSLLPGMAIAYLAAAILLRDWHSILNLSHRTATGLVAYGTGRLFEVAWKSVLVLLVWSGADYLIERHKLNSELRMSRQDLMDEYKETEGHPTIKARIRRLRRQVQRQRMLADVKRASVVITNPNEFAVALEYGPQLPAPAVIAKGRNLLAQQIKQEARWHGIPLVENPPLAHALYRSVEIGQSIPPKLYAVVAAVLAAIYRAQERATRKWGV
jgi:flagellar biosynthetic protein FlhB